MTDALLLREFLNAGSQEAFAELRQQSSADRAGVDQLIAENSEPMMP